MEKPNNQTGNILVYIWCYIVHTYNRCKTSDYKR